MASNGESDVRFRTSRRGSSKRTQHQSGDPIGDVRKLSVVMGLSNVTRLHYQLNRMNAFVVNGIYAEECLEDTFVVLFFSHKLNDYIYDCLNQGV